MPTLDLSALPRLPLLHGPTPLHPLPRLTEAIGGPTFWIKRDDLTPLALGGNKLRKLEFLLGEARAQDADLIITRGAVQSNHACQTAAAAARYGWETLLLLRGESTATRQGNLLLDELYGATIEISPSPSHNWEFDVGAEMRRAGRRPYVIPVGGSNAVGAVGFVAGGAEVQAQAEAEGIVFTEVVATSSSAGTQAGLVVAAAALDLPWRILGISVDHPAPLLQQRVAALAEATAAHAGLPTPKRSQVIVDDEFIGPGYGQIDARHRAAIAEFARLEGLLTDPVYTGKAVTGLLALARRGRWQKGEHVLFWHTGGLAALFAYADQLA